ncbi:hypothetical protein [Streptomyces arenae]|uniref:hypothetical protein n=1 Tax=Streptomyces arenae TaxID=29301 RepID=UPI00265A33CD|nr:hypothetical protein [Streptomyces arenae]MCG7203033.1 hypothetical protein [Streptomyces arenae]
MVTYGKVPPTCTSDILFVGPAAIRATSKTGILSLNMDLITKGYSDTYFEWASLYLRILTPDVLIVPHPDNNPTGEWSLWAGGDWKPISHVPVPPEGPETTVPPPADTATDYLRLRNPHIHLLRDKTGLIDGKTHYVGLKGMPDDGTLELNAWADALNVAAAAKSCEIHIADFKKDDSLPPYLD